MNGWCFSEVLLDEVQDLGDHWAVVEKRISWKIMLRELKRRGLSHSNVGSWYTCVD